MSEPSRTTCTTTQAGQLLGVSHDTIRSWWEQGLLDGYVSKPGKHGRLLIYRDSILAYDAKRKSRELCS